MMDNRTRFLNVLNFQKVDDRLPMIEYAGLWHKTLERWWSEGLPLNIGRMESSEYFGLDIIRAFRLETKNSDYPDMPQGQGPVIDDASYDRIRNYLYPKDLLERIRGRLMLVKDRLRMIKPLHEKGEVVIWMNLEGFFWHPRNLFGIENHLLMFYDNPGLMHRINNDLAEYLFYQIEEFCQILVPDFMTFAEDMSYNKGPMISYELFAEFMLPYYQKIVPVLKNHGIMPLIDSDGQIEPMIPWLKAAGLEGALPLERQSGVDIARIRRDYPAFKMIGGYDKRVMSQGEEAMRREFERLLPIMISGGYIPSCDHQTPPEVSLAHYRVYLKLLQEYCRKAIQQ